MKISQNFICNFTLNLIFIFTLIFCIKNEKTDSFLREKPSYITTCRRGSPNFQKCIKNLFNVFVRREYVEDFPELKNLTSFDPYFAPLITYVPQNSDAVNFKAELTNLTAKGISNFQIKEHQFSRRHAVMRSIFELDKLYMDGKYRLVGNILGFPVNGSGDFFIDLGDLTLTLYSNISLYEREGWTFMNITEFRVKLKVQKCKTNFANLFNADAAEVEHSANEVLNLFWRSLFEAQKPLIQEKFKELIEKIVNPALRRIPITFIVADMRDYYPLEIENLDAKTENNFDIT